MAQKHGILDIQTTEDIKKTSDIQNPRYTGYT